MFESQLSVYRHSAQVELEDGDDVNTTLEYIKVELRGVVRRNKIQRDIKYRDKNYTHNKLEGGCWKVHDF